MSRIQNFLFAPKTFFFHSFLVTSQKSFNESNLSSSSLSFSRSFTHKALAVRFCFFSRMPFSAFEMMPSEGHSLSGWYLLSSCLVYLSTTTYARQQLFDASNSTLHAFLWHCHYLFSFYHSIFCYQIVFPVLLTTCFAIESVHPGLLEEINVGGIFYWLTDLYGIILF